MHKCKYVFADTVRICKSINQCFDQVRTEYKPSVLQQQLLA